MFLSYYPEFCAKTVSSSNPLLRSFCVRSLKDFVGSLPDELLLYPVRALQEYISRTSSYSPHSCSLFLSPRSPSRALSMNALSFYVRILIAQASSFSPSASLPRSSSSSLGSLGSLRSSSSFRAHSIRGVVASVAHAMPLFHPFWRLPFRVLRPYLLPFTLVMFSSPLVRVSV